MDEKNLEAWTEFAKIAGKEYVQIFNTCDTRYEIEERIACRAAKATTAFADAMMTEREKRRKG